MERREFRKGVRTLKSRGMSHPAAVKKMRYYAATNNKPIKLSPKAAFYLILIILFALLGANKESAFFTKLFAGAIAGMITSEAAGSIVEKCGGAKLKKISWVLPFGPFKFSISVFAIVTAIVEFILFS
ncbi:MAG: hypothetical protein V1866_01695 [archaeon]